MPRDARSSRARSPNALPWEILSWSVRARGGSLADGLIDGVSELVGFRSDHSGVPPIVREYTSPEAELAGLAGQVRDWLDEGVPAERIAVATRRSKAVNTASNCGQPDAPTDLHRPTVRVVTPQDVVTRIAALDHFSGKPEGPLEDRSGETVGRYEHVPVLDFLLDPLQIPLVREVH